MAANSDPVGSGLVASLAQPGRNVTGLSVQSPDLAGKRIEILRDAVPGLRHVGILVSARSMIEAHEVQAAARILGLETPTIEVEHAEEIAPAVNALPLNVRYQGQPRHSADGAECPRMTRVGHRVGQNPALQQSPDLIFVDPV